MNEYSNKSKTFTLLICWVRYMFFTTRMVKYVYEFALLARKFHTIRFVGLHWNNNRIYYMNWHNVSAYLVKWKFHLVNFLFKIDILYNYNVKRRFFMHVIYVYLHRLAFQSSYYFWLCFRVGKCYLNNFNPTMLIRA